MQYCAINSNIDIIHSREKSYQNKENKWYNFLDKKKKRKKKQR